MRNNVILDYFRGVWSELKKVTWPSKNQVINHTIIVIVSATLAILLSSVIDLGLSQVVELVVRRES